MKKGTGENVQVKVVTITPEVAMKMLERNTQNRSITTVHVNRLSEEMAAGRWKMNGDTIRFSGDRLVDGQHRLWAVVESGATISSLVVEGLEDGVFDTIDIGRMRSHGDTLTTLKEFCASRAKSAAAALKVVDRYETGRLSSPPRYSNAEVLGLLEKHPEIRRSIDVCGYQAGLVPASMLIAFHYLAAQKSIEQADTFIRDFRTGAQLGQDDPVHQLRERFISISGNKRSLDLRCDYVFACLIRAWNARRDGRLLKRLVISDEDLNPSTAPRIK